jgi:hypothetical protein
MNGSSNARPTSAGSYSRRSKTYWRSHTADDCAGRFELTTMDGGSRSNRNRKPDRIPMTDPIPGITRCAIYTRKSRKFTGEYSSCDAQFDACHNFMRAHASLGWVWNGRRYDDQGESGARRDRPALTQLFADVTAGNVERVIVSSMPFCSPMKRARPSLRLRIWREPMRLYAEPSRGRSALRLANLGALDRPESRAHPLPVHLETCKSR